MDNIVEIVDDIENFNVWENDDLPASLNGFLKHVAQTGDSVFPWKKVKPIFRHKLCEVMSSFPQLYGKGDIGEIIEADGRLSLLSYIKITDNIIEKFDAHMGAPFTIQRICEILVEPRKHYNDLRKFVRGMEKNLLVVSCITPGYVRQPDTSQNSTVNGMIEDVSLHLGVNIPENNCNTGMKGTRQTNEVTANGLVEDTCSSSSSSGSSSASSSPSQEDEQESVGPTVKRAKLSIHEMPSSSYTNMFETPRGSTQSLKVTSLEEDGDGTSIPAEEHFEVLEQVRERLCNDNDYFPNKNSVGSPDSAKDCDKNLKIEKDSDNCEATATAGEKTEEEMKETEGIVNLGSSEADSISYSNSNEESTEIAEMSDSDKLYEGGVPQCSVSKETAETEVISTSDTEKCKTEESDIAFSESPSLS